MEGSFHTDLRDRLPLPLARLYRRSFNAKARNDRHQGAFHLLEATVKIGAAAQVRVYLAGGVRDAQLERRLAHLAMPSLGYWIEYLRDLSAATASLDPHPFPEIAGISSVLRTPREDLPAVAACTRMMGERIAGVPAFDGESVRPLDLLERLPAYRTEALGGSLRDDAFYAVMGEALLAAAVELLDRCPVWGRTVLAHVAEVHEMPSGARSADIWDLTGPEAFRATTPGGDELARDADVRAGHVYLRKGNFFLDLHPFLVYAADGPAEGVLFLNRSAERGTEHVDYVTGQASAVPALIDDHRGILGELLGADVSPERFAQLQAASLSDAAEPYGPTTAAATRFGDFDLLAKLGEGGMGTVYLARQRSISRLVALKMLPPSLAGDDVAAARFQREIRALARSDHPHVVRVLASGRTEGVYWFAMEHVEGSDLREVSATLGDSRGSLDGSDLDRAVSSASERRRRELADLFPGVTPLPKARPPDLRTDYFVRLAEVLADAATGLQHLHERGVIHRDVKPANVMVTRDGRAVVMDLGLARVIGESSLTNPASVLGTLKYAAPEQITHAVTRVDARADVYGLGATLYELATGRAPYDAEDVGELLRKVLAGSPPPPRSIDRAVPADLDAVIQRAMERDPGRRYRTAAALADDLTRFARREPVTARPPSLAYLFRLWVRRHAAVAATVAAALVVVIIGTLLFLNRLTDERDRATRHADAEQRERRMAQALAASEQRAKESAQRATATAERHLATAYVFRARSAPTPTARWLLSARACDLDATAEGRGTLVELSRTVHRALWISPRPVGDAPFGLAWSPDSTVIACGFGDEINLWDIRTGDQIMKLTGHADTVISVAFSPDGTRIASGSMDKTIRLWDTASGAEVATLAGDVKEVSSVAFSPDGRRVASASNDPTVRIWDAVLGREIARLDGHSDAAWHVAFATPSTVASTSKDGTVRLWDVDSRAEIATFRRDGHPLALSRNGKLAVWKASPDNTVSIHDTESGTAIAKFPQENGADGFWSGAVSIAADGRSIASASGSTLRLWDVTSGTQVATLAGLDGPDETIRDIAWSADGSMVASISRFCTIRLWDFRKGVEIARFSAMKGHHGPVACVCFSPDGSQVASAAGEIALWDAKTGKPLATLQGTDDSPDAPLADPTKLVARPIPSVHAMVFSPDCKTVAGGLSDGTIRLWDVSSAREMAKLKRHEKSVSHIAFSPDGTKIASASVLDKTVRLWDASKAKEIAKLQRDGEAPRSIRFSRDGTKLGLVYAKSVGVWDFGPKEEIKVIPDLPAYGELIALSEDAQTFALASPEAADMSRFAVRLYRKGGAATLWGWDQLPRIATFSPDGSRLATALGSAIKVWDVESGSEIATLEGHEGHVWFGGARMTEPSAITCIAFSPDGTRIVSAAGDATCRVWDVGTAARATLALSSTGVGLLRDGTIVSGGWDGVTLWDGESGRKLAKFTTPAKRGSIFSCSAFALSPDGTRAAASLHGNDISIFDIHAGKEIARFVGHAERVNAIAFGPGGTKVVSASGDRTVRVWDADSAKETAKLEHEWPVHCVAISPSGKWVAWGSRDGVLRLWGPDSGVATSMERHEGDVNSIAFAPDGTRLASAADDGMVRLWDVASGRSVARFEGHTGPVRSVVFVPCQGSLASASDDGTVRLWDEKSGKEIARLFEGGGKPVLSIAFSPDGTKLASISGDAVRISEIEPLFWPQGECLRRAEEACDSRLLGFESVPKLTDRLVPLDR